MSNNEQKRGSVDSAAKLIDAAVGEFKRDGKVTSVRCDVCSSVIEIVKLREGAFTIRCTCGKFRGNLLGI